MDVQNLKPVPRKEDLDEKEPENKTVEMDAELQPTPSSEPSSIVDEFPDGGFKAWAVVLGAFCAFFASLGYSSSWGIFQVEYQQVILPHSTPSQIAWIGSVARCMNFVPAVLIGRLCDLGYFRATFTTGCILIIIGTFLIPLCTVYWHFLLCQGFMMGIGYGLTYAPCVTVIAQWWCKKRGLAFGVACSASAIGGVFFPVALRNILPKLGFTWSLRIMGFILIFTFGVANLCLVPRLQPQKAQGGLFGLSVFRSPAFAVYALSAFLGYFSVANMASYMASSAVSYGLSSNIAFYLVAISNATSLLGSVGAGFAGDRLGAMNVLIPSLAAAGIITIIWPFCGTVASLSVISVLYGVTCGAYGPLTLVPVAAMGGTEDLGRRMGTMTTILGIGTLCGPPLAGLLNSTSLGYKAVGYFSGGIIFLATILLVLARFLAVPKLRAKF